jgi:hypothetical protein
MTLKNETKYFMQEILNYKATIINKIPVLLQHEVTHNFQLRKNLKQGCISNLIAIRCRYAID